MTSRESVMLLFRRVAIVAIVFFASITPTIEQRCEKSPIDVDTSGYGAERKRLDPLILSNYDKEFHLNASFGDGCGKSSNDLSHACYKGAAHG